MMVLHSISPLARFITSRVNPGRRPSSTGVLLATTQLGFFFTAGRNKSQPAVLLLSRSGAFVLLYLLGSLLVIRVGQRPSLFYFPLEHRVNNVVGSLRSLDFPLSIPTLQTFIFAFGYKNPFVEGEDFRDSVKESNSSQTGAV